MIAVVKSRDIHPLMPHRAADSHKGMNGRVLIVGGSLEYSGAPLLCGLGALNSGSDLVHLFVPECNFDVSRGHYPDFLVQSFPGNFLDASGVPAILELAKNCDAILIGPGLGEREETMEAILQLVLQLQIPTILDASAIQVLQKIKKFPLQQKMVITPHHNEFEHLTGKEVKISTSVSAKVVLVRTLATDLHINILLKGPESFIASEKGDVVTNSNGNAGMTVGGSGDVLAGFVTSMIAQGVDVFDACKLSSFVFGETGDALFKEKGYGFSASDLAMELPYVLKKFLA